MAIRKRKTSQDTADLNDSDDNVSSENAYAKKPKGSFTEAGSELGSVVEQISSAYGANIVRRLGRARPYEDRLATGIFVLDLALAGGFLTSRGHMVYGERSAGKSTIAMRAAVAAQQLYPDQVVAWLDVEGTFDEYWFAKHGGNPDLLYLIEPESGEHAVDMADAFARSKETSLLVTDSIAMLVPMKEIEASAEDSLPGVHARLVGNYLRRINSALLKERHRNHRLSVLHINQFRMKIGLAFGDPRTLPGGKALEFSTSQQVEARNKEIVSKDGVVQYNEHSFVITKDKTGGRYKSGKFKMVRDPASNGGLPEGTIDQAGSILSFGEKVGMVTGRYEIEGYGKAPSKEAWMKKFIDDPEMEQAIMFEIIQRFRKEWGLTTL
jgi:recombination protein RecA